MKCLLITFKLDPSQTVYKVDFVAVEFTESFPINKTFISDGGAYILSFLSIIILQSLRGDGVWNYFRLHDPFLSAHFNEKRMKVDF